ncbi:flagellar hook-basal body complex protein FliE [Halobacillus shinanisalinarum]|uniref:Flagellar hook-basal body complex protein FliE n=1 Tax=Halobacillus shinanisalinarum TaxID=2932258 RepID=A0ABY4GZ49_9BACI|nr:flagellar hook-basal body complex protein FliE [Halobacillus shinanisalinarum]UOQ93216.1 flagellar hook-basal body complex protein FliE [Halobacillus shinanisalinarum]
MVNWSQVTNESLIKPVQTQTKSAITPSDAHSLFANRLREAINQVNDAAVASDVKTKALARGEVDDLHDVMITSQKASITMQTTIEIRNKVVDAYKEIMRMQV